MSHDSICISLTSALSRCWGSEQVRLLSAEEIAERTEVSQLPLSWVAGSTGIMLKYAYATQRGYYPNEMKKLNQDAFKIVPSFGEDPRRFLMGVFDGHGDCGELAARFVRDNIETTLISLCARYRSDLATALRMTFMQINQRLIHQQEHYMALSGTTACTCFVDGTALYVANVGDSRAVLGKRNSKSLVVAVPLSADQTPYRADERKRIRAAGGLVMSYHQLQGNAPMHDNWNVTLGRETDSSGDPPRVWKSGSQFVGAPQLPGAAFTRSIGDSIAEKIGVIAEPEISTHTLSLPEDTVIVLASDGVWEFLTNQAAVDLVMPYAESSDPVAACRVLAAESYRLWMMHDVRTDDITAVVAFLQNSAPLLANLV
jgi:serine/threonine protein phosphatase PrpC